MTRQSRATRCHYNAKVRSYAAILVKGALDDLIADLGAFALVGRREGLIEQDQRSRGDMVYNIVHARQFFIKFCFPVRRFLPAYRWVKMP